MNNLEITKERAIEAYNNATDEQKQLLTDLFGEGVFRPKNVMERVKIFEDACKELGDSHPFVLQYNWIVDNNFLYEDGIDLLAYLQLKNITNNTNLKTGGYEQNRDDYYYDEQASTTSLGESKAYKFSKNSKYYYAYAFNTFLNIGFRF